MNFILAFHVESSGNNKGAVQILIIYSIENTVTEKYSKYKKNKWYLASKLSYDSATMAITFKTIRIVIYLSKTSPLVVLLPSDNIASNAFCLYSFIL